MNVIVNNTKLEADGKFSHPDVTAKGEKRARVGLTKTQEIGITGGEPFMNPDILKIMETSLKRGFKLLVLTNAMRPMMKCAEGLLKLNENYGEQMTLRVSVDHFKPELHEEERGANSWEPMMKGLQWLSENKFHIDVAGRTRWGEEEQELRDGFDEITTACWGILNVNPADMMCSSSRMVVKHKGDEKPSVQACTLLAYDQQFNLGNTIKEASKPVPLNHRFCAKFCVLGGGACSVKD